MSPTFRALRIRNYRLYAAGAVVSNVGTWMQRVAQDWLVLQLTDGSGVALGVTTALQFLPLLLFSLYGGVLADRYPKRRVLVASQVSMASVAALLGVLVLSGVVVVWHVFVMAFLLGLASAVDMPVRQAFVTEMVGRDDVTNAVGLNSASFNAARVVGPALAGLLIVAFDTGPVFLLNALSTVAVVVALMRMRTAELHPTDPLPREPGQVREGLRYVWHRPDLMLVLVVVFFVGTFGLNFQMTTALMATNVFGKGAGEYGVLGSVMAVGSLTGSLLAARRGRPRLRLVVLAAVAFGTATVAAGLMPSYLTFAAWLVVVGLTALTLITAANATMQLSTAPAMRGRVMALYTMVFFGGTPVGAPLIGWVAQAFGARWSLLLGGAVSALAPLVAAAVVARRGGIRVRPSFAQGRPRLDVVTQAPAQVVEHV